MISLRSLAGVAALSLAGLGGWAAENAFAPASSVILDMDTVRHNPGEGVNQAKQRVPNGTVELVEGKFGQAVRFSFAGGLGPGFMTAWVPAADAFKPDFVLVSAGFDAAQGDLLGRMKITPDGYVALTRIVKDIAERHCQGRLVSVLEGGYNLEALAASVEAHVRTLKQ